MSNHIETRFAPGSIVRLKNPVGDSWSAMRIEHVLVLDQPAKPFDSTRPEIVVAPIAPYTKHAAEYDVYGRPGDGNMTTDFLIEIWNQRAMLVSELEPVAMGIVAPPTLRTIYAIHNAMFEIEPADAAAMADVGPIITEATDPRIEYQAQRSDMAEQLSSAANAVWQSACEERPTSRGKGEKRVVGAVVSRMIWGTFLQTGDAYPLQRPVQYRYLIRESVTVTPGDSRNTSEYPTFQMSSAAA